MSVKERLVNTHIDVCISRRQATAVRDSSGSGRSGGEQPRLELQKVPKRNFALDKEGTLRAVLRRYGLPATGTKDALIARYKEFHLR